MKKSHTVLLGAFLALVTVLGSGCPERRSIADINANPGRYHNKEVAVAGTVTDSYGISLPGMGSGGGVYKIDDGTGSIWVVVADNSVPQKGDRIAIKGRVSSGVSWAGKNYGLGVMETGRRYPPHR